MNPEWVSAIADSVTAISAGLGVFFWIRQFKMLKNGFDAENLDKRLSLYTEIVNLTENELTRKLTPNLASMELGKIVKFRKDYRKAAKKLDKLKFKIYSMYPDKKIGSLVESLILEIDKVITGKSVLFTYDLEHYAKDNMELKLTDDTLPSTELEHIRENYQKLKDVESTVRKKMDEFKNALASTFEKSAGVK